MVLAAAMLLAGIALLRMLRSRHSTRISLITRSLEKEKEKGVKP